MGIFCVIKKQKHRKIVDSYVFIRIIFQFVVASFSNTPHVFFQVAVFYQIWRAYFFRDTLSQLPDLWYPIDISPLYSPTFHVLIDNLFNKYNMPYFAEVNLDTLLAVKKRPMLTTFLKWSLLVTY